MCSQKWGRIINITSVAGMLGGYGQSSYAAAKAGLISMAKSAALEGARYNITVNCILVGIVKTEAFTDLLPPEVQERVAKKTVWGRAAETEEIASAASYLVSEDAHYMTGAIVNMLGGMDLFVF
jgi:3-oxoacyl-[acyl-carrier protein] reductase